MTHDTIWARAQRALDQGADDALMTLEEYAAVRRCCRSTAWRDVKNGKIAAVRIGRTTRVRLGDVRRRLRGDEAAAHD